MAVHDNSSLTIVIWLKLTFTLPNQYTISCPNPVVDTFPIPVLFISNFLYFSRVVLIFCNIILGTLCDAFLKWFQDFYRNQLNFLQNAMKFGKRNA